MINYETSTLKEKPFKVESEEYCYRFSCQPHLFKSADRKHMIGSHLSFFKAFLKHLKTLSV